MIIVIDYGMGNLRSVVKAIEKVSNETVRVSSSALDIRESSKMVFPGVGSFADGINELSKRNLIVPIKEAISNKKPFLGICLGLQLLFEESEEAPGIKGLGILKGKVKKFSKVTFSGEKVKIPHIGWNNINLSKQDNSLALFKGIEDNSFVYFVHSYYAEPRDASIISSTADYGLSFCASIEKDNVYATQFHPEKSQEIGLKMLKNFCEV